MWRTEDEDVFHTIITVRSKDDVRLWAWLVFRKTGVGGLAPETSKQLSYIVTYGSVDGCRIPIQGQRACSTDCRVQRYY